MPVAFNVGNCNLKVVNADEGVVLCVDDGEEQKRREEVGEIEVSTTYPGSTAGGIFWASVSVACHSNWNSADCPQGTTNSILRAEV